MPSSAPRRPTRYQRALADKLLAHLRAIHTPSIHPIRTPTNAALGWILGASEQTVGKVIALLASDGLLEVEYLPVRHGSRTRHRRRITLRASGPHLRAEFAWSHLGGRLTPEDTHDAPDVDPLLQARFNRPRPGFFQDFIAPAMTTLCDPKP